MQWTLDLCGSLAVSRMTSYLFFSVETFWQLQWVERREQCLSPQGYSHIYGQQKPRRMALLEIFAHSEKQLWKNPFISAAHHWRKRLVAKEKRFLSCSKLYNGTFSGSLQLFLSCQNTLLHSNVRKLGVWLHFTQSSFGASGKSGFLRDNHAVVMYVHLLGGEQYCC